MTKTDNFRGKFDEILVFPKYVCVLRNYTLIYGRTTPNHYAFCVMLISSGIKTNEFCATPNKRPIETCPKNVVLKA